MASCSDASTPGGTETPAAPPTQTEEETPPVEEETPEEETPDAEGDVAVGVGFIGVGVGDARHPFGGQSPTGVRTAAPHEEAAGKAEKKWDRPSEWNSHRGFRRDRADREVSVPRKLESHSIRGTSAP